MEKAYMEHFHYMKTLGFTGHVERFDFRSEVYKKLLEVVGNRYNYNFKISIELTKKEIRDIKAFLIVPNSVLPIKYYIDYESYEKIPNKKICFKNKKICMFKEHNINGIPSVKDNFFKTFEVWYNLIIATDYIKSKIKNSTLSGIEFGDLIDIKTQQSISLSCLYSNILMHDKCLDTNLDFENKKEHNFLIYENLNDINDFNYTSEPFEYDQSGIIVSQNFKYFYNDNKLKGLFFYPVFEKDSILFEKLNTMIIEFATELLAYNAKHTIGNNRTSPTKLVTGILNV